MSPAQSALAGALLLSGALNALPALGLLGGSQLTSLYGLPFEDASLRILMRHRALLFGLLGAAMILAAFLPPWRAALAGIGLLSMLGFIGIAWLEGGGNVAIQRVVLADVLASALLAPALLWSWLARG
ncbi:MAG: hypothetical protein Q8Q73_09080 [Stagnimonas sp.]|nr:hypothetical protein [Stagnimonas sp.]